jgi:hypothetical protein
MTSVRINVFLLSIYKLSVSYAKSKKVRVHSVYVVDQQTHTGTLSYIINYLHVTVAIATIVRVSAQEY